ncbi:MAG: hypothetical protein V4555_13160 [Acidobacteriota bacterium]
MPKPATVTTAQFVSVLADMKKPGPSIRKLLKAHYNAKGRVSTMSLLAHAAGFTSFSPANLHYGDLAKRIGKHLAITEPSLQLPARADAYLSLLVDFIRPEAVTNVHWLLVMKPEFAEALKQSRWL